MKRCVIWSMTCLLGAASLVAPSTPIRAADKAAGTAVLEKKGLKKSGAAHILADDEMKVTKGLKDLQDAKKKVAQDARERRKLEKFINQAKGFIGNADLERRKLNDELATTADAFGHNRIIAKMNSLTSKINEAITYKETQEKKLKALGDAARSDYIGVVMKLEEQVKKVEEKYAGLAADDEVKAALASTKPPGKLGPSAAFALAANQLKKLRADIAAETINVTMENDIPWVDVTINGSSTRQFVFDTGASIIAIPADMAKALELVAPKDATIIRLQLADGKVVEGKLIMLKTVRVGTFEVNDVEAAILPESLVAAAPLLGGSFHRNFIHKLDTGKGELHLARIGPGAQKDQKSKEADGGGAAGASDDKEKTDRNDAKGGDDEKAS